MELETTTFWLGLSNVLTIRFLLSYTLCLSVCLSRRLWEWGTCISRTYAAQKKAGSGTKKSASGQRPQVYGNLPETANILLTLSWIHLVRVYARWLNGTVELNYKRSHHAFISHLLTYIHTYIHSFTHI